MWNQKILVIDICMEYNLLEQTAIFIFTGESLATIFVDKQKWKIRMNALDRGIKDYACFTSCFSDYHLGISVCQKNNFLQGNWCWAEMNNTHSLRVIQ